ncbi:hypothetical protein ABZ545_01270 [Streptomyces abikoensis]|uniref:hypothetical protein n=1 Tax=Streptomyces abikoensis TaxID=97398 RepID=UPI0033F6BC6F
MSWRRLRILIEHLPPESATMTALRNSLDDDEWAEHAERGEPEAARWSQLEQLTAALIDAVRRVEYVLICVNRDGKSPPPDPPEPIPRPGTKTRTKRPPLSDESAEILFRLINGGA